MYTFSLCWLFRLLFRSFRVWRSPTFLSLVLLPVMFMPNPRNLVNNNVKEDFPYPFLFFFYFTILYWFCHTSTWIRHRCTCVPHPETLSHLPPHTIPLGHPSAPARSILYPASNLDWWFISYMILYMFQCHSPKSSHPHRLSQSPEGCSIHLCLFCCLAYRVIVTIFLNSIYMR